MHRSTTLPPTLAIARCRFLQPGVAGGLLKIWGIVLTDLTLTTFEWVPEAPRGFVRDLRARWALEEAALPYGIDTVPLRGGREAHLAHQPFGQVPWLTDGAISVFESGAILLHLGNLSERLLPSDPRRRSEAISWLFAALNSVEPPVMSCALYRFARDTQQTPGREGIEAFLQGRLQHMERVLAESDWLAGTFSIADIAIADVLRTVDRFAGGLDTHPACRAYIQRATSRPAFVKARDDQMAHFAAADRAREGRSPAGQNLAPTQTGVATTTTLARER